MKKSLLSAVSLMVLGAASVSANANQLVATQSFTASNCAWVQNYTSAYESGYSLVCDGTTAVTKKVVHINNTCTFPSVGSGYSLTAASCANFSVYKITSSTTTTSACQASGKYGVLYMKNAYGPSMSTIMPQASAYCGSCGVVTLATANSMYWDLYCGKQ
jgi:hypothetical protein